MNSEKIEELEANIAHYESACYIAQKAEEMRENIITADRLYKKIRVIKKLHAILLRLPYKMVSESMWRKFYRWCYKDAKEENEISIIGNALDSGKLKYYDIYSK